MSCAGTVLRGPSIGQPCGGHALYACRGKQYCAAHYAVASKAPGRFRAAVEASYRRLARQEIQRRARGAQLDAFEIDPPSPMTGEQAATYIDGYDPMADIDANVPAGNAP